MPQFKSEGYADIAALQRVTADLPTGEVLSVSEDAKTHIQELCRQITDILRPFALTSSTNERWRKEILAIAEQVHKTAMGALHNGDPVVASLSEGIDGLQAYEKNRKSQSHDAICEMFSNAQQVVDSMQQAIDRCHAAASTQPLDTWELYDAAQKVCDQSISILYRSDRIGDDSANTLLERSAAAVRAALAQTDIPEHMQKDLAHCVSVIERRQGLLAQRREVRRKFQERLGLSREPFANSGQA
ncbi:MAG: hypothetical protein PHU04_02745 [Candidatus Peribacteraceae bacterium]|nr:hypothetical protein [Candidatus Peribacteraceae bacterium]